MGQSEGGMSQHEIPSKLEIQILIVNSGRIPFTDQEKEIIIVCLSQFDNHKFVFM